MSIIDGRFPVSAPQERLISNARHAVRDSDGGEGGATFERLISNARHAVFDSNVGDSRAKIKISDIFFYSNKLNLFSRDCFESQFASGKRFSHHTTSHKQYE